MQFLLIFNRTCNICEPHTVHTKFLLFINGICNLRKKLHITVTLEKTNDILDVFMKAESMCIYISTQPFASIMIRIRFVVNTMLCYPSYIS